MLASWRCQPISSQAQHHLKTFLAANRESTCSSHEYESESSGVDSNQSEVLEPLDLSTSKKSIENCLLDTSKFSATSITRELKMDEPIKIDNDIHQSDLRTNTSDALDLRYVFIHCMQSLCVCTRGPCPGPCFLKLVKFQSQILNFYFNPEQKNHIKTKSFKS